MPGILKSLGMLNEFLSQALPAFKIVLSCAVLPAETDEKTNNLLFRSPDEGTKGSYWIRSRLKQNRRKVLIK